MGKHKEWRKLVKKLRRKRIRSILAQERDELLRIEKERLERSPRYQSWLQEQEALEIFQREEEERQSEERHRRWLQEEEQAQAAWRDKQLRVANAKEEQQKQIMLLKEKLIEEEKKIKEEVERNNEEKERDRMRQEQLKKAIDDYISGLVNELPDEVRQTNETHPGKMECPFFSKVAACRFFDSCSRNHIKPGISKILLFPGLYAHFSLRSHTSRAQEYDTDISLEFENAETYSHFVEFYRDVVGEVRKLGKISLVKVCKNSESHLRGNLYVQFRTERDALRAYSRLLGRYYAGKQLTPIFVSVPSWRNAICGLQWNNRCTKGSLCNFLHVFNNPNGDLCWVDYDTSDSDSPRRSSRWSESPEDRSDQRSSRRLHHDKHRSRENSRSNQRKDSRRNKRERHNSHRQKDSDRRKHSDLDRRRHSDLGRRSRNDSSRRHKGHSSQRKLSDNKDKEHKKSRNVGWSKGGGTAPGWDSSSDEDVPKTNIVEIKKT